MAESRYGIELDGVHATLVETLSRSAVSANVFTGESPADALKQALAALPAKRKAIPVRLAIVSATTSMRRIDVTAAAMASRSAFEEVAYKSVSAREGTTVAGLFFNSDALVGEAMGSGVAVLAPSEPVDDAYRALGDLDGEIVPPALTLAGTSGLHLAIRYTNADLTLVVDGRPVQHRQLPAGGLTALAAGIDAESGPRRLEALFNRSGAPDPLAASELDRYLRALAADVRTTVDRWSTTGDEIPEEIHAFGPGARISDLTDHLSDLGLSLTASDELARAMAYIPIGAREGATGAFLAALTHGRGMPQAAFPSPVVVEKAAARTANRRRTRLIATAAGVLALPALIYFGPVAAGQLSISNAEDARDQAQARLSAVSAERAQLDRITTLSQTFSTATATDPDWPRILEVVYGSAAASDVGVGSVNATVAPDGTGVAVEVTASSADPNFGTLTSWLNLLGTEFGAQGATTSRFSALDDGSSDGSSFDVSFTLPPEAAFSERPVPGAQN